jgi:hypothetical protein
MFTDEGDKTVKKSGPQRQVESRKGKKTHRSREAVNGETTSGLGFCILPVNVGVEELQ